MPGERWHVRRSKKVSLGLDPLPLPRDVPVGKNCDEDQVHWGRLQTAAVAFELSFVVRVRPWGAPSCREAAPLPYLAESPSLV